MPYEIFLALRYLRAQQRHRLARVTTLIAVVGIAVGVGALVVALALANGFRDEMRDKILRGTAHLTVMRSDGQPMQDYQDMAARIRKVEGVVAAAGTTYDGTVIIGPGGSAYAVLRGLDGTPQPVASAINRSVVAGAAPQILELRNTLVAGSIDDMFHQPAEKQDPSPVALGAELAARTGLTVGATAEIVGASNAFSAANGRKRQVYVAAIFRSGLFEYDSTWIYLPLDTAAAFSGNAHAASVVSIQVNDIYQVKQIATKVRQLLGSSYSTVDWQEANRPLFTALALERRLGIIIIALIVLIAALNITTTLILIVMERRRDIAILNAMGATTRSIMGIFILEGAIVGAGGALAGVALGAMAIVIANRYHLISLPADVYSISNVPLNLDFPNLALAALVAMVLSIVATIYPARAAARVRPAELLRDGN